MMKSKRTRRGIPFEKSLVKSVALVLYSKRLPKAM